MTRAMTRSDAEGEERVREDERGENEDEEPKLALNRQSTSKRASGSYMRESQPSNQSRHSARNRVRQNPLWGKATVRPGLPDAEDDAVDASREIVVWRASGPSHYGAALSCCICMVREGEGLTAS
jgi:hypothetical protein